MCRIPDNPQNRLYKQTIFCAAVAFFAYFTQAKWAHQSPLSICQHASNHALIFTDLQALK